MERAAKMPAARYLRHRSCFSCQSALESEDEARQHAHHVAHHAVIVIVRVIVVVSFMLSNIEMEKRAPLIATISGSDHP